MLDEKITTALPPGFPAGQVPLQDTGTWQQPREDRHLHPRNQGLSARPTPGSTPSFLPCRHRAPGGPDPASRALRAAGVFQPATCGRRSRERSFLEGGGAVSPGMQAA